MDWIEVLDRHRSFLVDRLDLDFGILDDLLSSGYLTRPEMQRIKNGQDSYERNEKLLDLVRRKSNFHEFLEALKSSNQNHLSNFISANGDYKEEFGGDWPLSEAEASMLDVNQRFLVDHLDTCELIMTLYSADVINRRQREWISSKRTSFKQNEALLELLRKFSINNFQKTIFSLHLTQQGHIAQVLECRAAAVPLHCEIESSNDRAEDDLIDRLTELLSDRPLGDCARILAATQLKLIAVKKTSSILLYFLCETLKDLLLLEELEKTDRMKVSLKVVFNQLLSRDEVIRVKTRLFEDDCLKGERFFLAKLSTKNTDKSNTTTTAAAAAAAARSLIVDLPVELMDTILLKAFLIFQMEDLGSNRQQHSIGDILIKMAASGDWLQLILDRRFRRRFWRHLTALQRKRRKRTLIDKTMSAVAKETVRLKAVVNQLRINDCFTDLQVKQLLRCHVTTSKPLNRNDELLRITESLDDAKRREFLLCLRQNDQNSTAKLFVKGGIALRVEIRCGNRSEGLEMVKRIGELQKRAKQRLLPPMQRLLQRLKDNAIELVSVGLDAGQPVTWLCCCSQPPGDRVGHFASFVCREFSEAVASFRSLNVDSDQLKKDFLVSSERQLKFSARKQLPDDHRLRGVTVSRDRIYVLCRSSSSSSDQNSILVFDDCDPFELRMRIQLKRVVDPEDFEFVERTESFYITDSSERCIWRLRRVKCSITRWIKLLGRPATLSSSSTGRRLLMALRGKTFTTLAVYDVTSGHLNHSVVLPADVMNVRHVAMTSSGTFYLLHQLDRWTQWSISEFMMDAEEVKLLQRFTAKESTQLLTDPLYLAVDLEDQVYVTDSWSNRVVQLDSTLTWKRFLSASSPGNEAKQLSLVWSNRLHYDCRKGRLIVGGLNSVDIFT